MSAFLGTAIVIVLIALAGTGLTVLCACILGGRADDVIERGGRIDDN